MEEKYSGRQGELAFLLPAGSGREFCNLFRFRRRKGVGPGFPADVATLSLPAHSLQGPSSSSDLSPGGLVFGACPVASSITRRAISFTSGRSFFFLAMLKPSMVPGGSQGL